MAKTKALICPYCGETQPVADRCRACGGLFEPLSRQATHNEMGPWYIRDVNRPFQPGCSYETLIKLIERGQVNKFTILRGPTTKQFWTIARRVPGVSHLLGYCHNCDASVDVGDHGCHACGVPFGAYLDRNYLGLPEIRPLPWEASHEDEERGQEGGSRMIDFRRAAEPLGISSFASDEELRGGLPTAAQAIGFPPATINADDGGPRLGVAGVTVSPQSFPDPRLAVNPGFIAARADNPPPSHAVIETARQVARQRRLVRLLTAALIVTAIAAAVLVVLLLRHNTEQARPVAPSQAAAPADSVEPTGDTTSAGAAQPDQATPPEMTEAAATQGQIEVEALLVQAQEHIAAGEDANNSLELRIAAYDEALKLLKKIDSEAAAAHKPPDLAERIKSIEQIIRDLRLKAFFP